MTMPGSNVDSNIEGEVSDLRLVSIAADARNYEMLPEAIRVDFELGRFMSRLIEAGIRVRTQASVEYLSDEEPEEPLAQIKLWYEVDLILPAQQAENAMNDDPTMQELVDTLVAPVLYPYVRSKVHDLTNELPLPSTLLPTFPRISGNDRAE